MTESTDLLAFVRKIGLRTSRDAFDAWLTHATKSKASPVEIIEQLCALEQREREVRNLARRQKMATLEAPKRSTASIGTIPARSTGTSTSNSTARSTSCAAEKTSCFAGRPASARRRSPRISACAPSSAGIPSDSVPCLPRSRTS